MYLQRLENGLARFRQSVNLPKVSLSDVAKFALGAIALGLTLYVVDQAYIALIDKVFHVKNSAAALLLTIVTVSGVGRLSIELVKPLREEEEARHG